MMWLTTEEFKKNTNISDMEESEITTILTRAKERLVSYIFPKKMYKSNYSRDYHDLELDDLYISDAYTYDDEINKTSTSTSWEVNAYEIDDEFNEYPLNSLISAFKHKYGRIEFSSNVPTVSGRELRIEYWLAKFPWNEIKERVKDLQQLIALQYLIPYKPTAAAAFMAKSWSLNGVSIDSGADSIQAITDAMELIINRKISELQPLLMVSRDTKLIDTPYYYKKF